MIQEQEQELWVLEGLELPTMDRNLGSTNTSTMAVNMKTTHAKVDWSTAREVLISFLVLTLQTRQIVWTLMSVVALEVQVPLLIRICIMITDTMSTVAGKLR